jgi:predicted enzyme related to lactoylglutathione lyase
MPHVAKHAPGNFCWIELATTDQSAGKEFYSELFGWTISEFPMGPKDFYTTFEIDGRDVAAVYTLRPEQQARGVPAHWSLYVAVENADTAADRARGLGAKVIAEPFDVYTSGGWQSCRTRQEPFSPCGRRNATTASVLKAFPVHSVWLT